MAQVLASASIPYAVGGSCLLYSLGLADRMHDVDFTIDADLAQVLRALRGLTWHHAQHGDPPFASAYRLTIAISGPAVDLIGSFAIETAVGVCHLPTLVHSMWRGLPVASPEVWAVAYHLMKRREQADMLCKFIRGHGAQEGAVQALLRQPLPDELRREVAAWSNI